MQHRRIYQKVIGLAVLIWVVISLLLPTAQRVHAADTRQTALEQAWELARQSGSYHFDTRITQTTHPAPALANVGKTSKIETIYLEGETDLPTQAMHLRLWQDGGSLLNRGDGVEMRVEGNQAYARLDEGDWQEIDNFTSSFAPGNDLSAFLAGAQDIRPADLSTFDLQQYTFTLHTPSVAKFLRAQLEDHLRQRGELPPGLGLETPNQLANALGQGQVWVDADGLPARLSIDLEYPQEANGERIEVSIVTNFSGFNRDFLTAASNPLKRVLSNVAADFNQQRANVPVIFSASGLGLLGLLWFKRRPRQMYCAIVAAVIVSMLFSPLLQSAQAVAFSRQQNEQQAAFTQAQEEQAAAEKAQEQLYDSDWDPHQKAVPSDPVSRVTSSLDHVTQGNMTPKHVTQSNTTQSDPSADDDGDGLTNLQEERLGTEPDEIDSDNDGISDDAETDGFDYNGQHWYTNPLSGDSNNDGLPDGVECPEQVPDEEGQRSPRNGDGSLPACRDTDGDGTPDVFDRDDDGDGVPDRVDLSPTAYLDHDGQPFTNDSPLLFKVDALQANMPVFVDFQLRPESADHLWYALHVLDWPSGDEQGQIQRKTGNDSTFESVAGEDETIAANSADGDMRLVPMLEVEIPYQDGHYANLPVLDGAPVRTPDNLDDWLDREKLDPYGISVRQLNDDGDLALYAPLNLVRDETGEDRVAFNTRLLYWPTDADWGNTQKVRVVWLVQMLTDYQDGDEWTLDVPQIVRAYPEQWSLTGLRVSEDHGLDVAIIYEDPAQETEDERRYDDWLWTLAHGLDAAYLSGRDCDTKNENDDCVGDGQRDITIPEIVNRWDYPTNQNNGYQNGDDALWELPITATQVLTYSYAHEGYLGHIAMTETVELLDDVFTPYVETGADAPTLLFAVENDTRTLGLDHDEAVIIETTEAGNTLLTFVLDEENAPREIRASIKWAPYHQEDGEWASYSVDAYWDQMSVRLKDSWRPEYADDPDWEDILDGQLLVAQSYYLALAQGLNGLVQRGDTPSNYDIPDIDDPSLANWLFDTDINKAGGLIARSTYSMANQLAKVIKLTGYNKNPKLLFKALKQLFESGKSAGLMKLVQWKQTAWGNVKLGMLFVTTLVALGVAITAGIFLGKGMTRELALLLASGFALHGVLDMILTIKKVAGKLAENGWKLTDAMKAQGFKYKAGAAAVGLIIAIAITWGIFIYLWASEGLKPGSLALNQLFAYTVAGTITAIIMIAIAVIPIIGQIIATLIFLIDAITMLVCEASKSDNKFCIGITGWVTKGIAWAIYGAHVMVDTDDEEILKVETFEQEFENSDLGMTVGNRLIANATLRSQIDLIHYWNDTHDWKAAAYRWQYSDNTLASTTFDFALQASEKDIHSGLDRNDIRSDWDRSDGRPFVLVAAADEATIPLNEAGINRGTRLYLTMGYALPLQECWAFPIVIPFPPFYLMIPVCYVRTERDSVHMDLGKNFAFDIFPATLDEFMALHPSPLGGGAGGEGGYSLAWSPDTNPTFPRLKDADGDGLRNKLDGGADPNDLLWDSDGDGLSDYAETQLGSSPNDPDSDSDGLSDYDEALRHTRPTLADSDYDGLTDGEEVIGWEFVYDFAPDGTQLRTWVTSDPLSADSDGDGMTDFMEKTYGFHPQVESDPDILTLDSQAWEANAPALLLRMDEITSASFHDSSGHARNAECAIPATCPAPGYTGAFRNAPHFDGDDFLRVGGLPGALDTAALSLAVWVRPESGMSEDGMLLAFSTVGVGDTNRIAYDITGQRFYYADGGIGPVYANVTSSYDTWSHVAVTIAENGSGALYVNGNLAGSFSTAQRPDPAGIFGIGQAFGGSNDFRGRMDEILVFEHALNPSEIQTIMQGRYNPQDQAVLPGDALGYQARVTNELFNRYAQGLLSADFPIGFGEVPPEDFVLNPQETITLTGALNVSPTAASGVYSLTQQVDAMITDWRELSNYAELLWHFSENAAPFEDSSGAQPPRDGQCDGAACPASVNGKHGSGLHFDGVDDYVYNDDISSFLGKAISYGAWVYPEAGMSENGTILAFNTVSGANRNQLSFDPASEHFFYSDGTQDVHSVGSFAPGAWYHVVVTLDSDNHGVLYINGERQASFSTSVRPVKDGKFSAGQEWDGGTTSNFFRGTLDEVMLFNRALSADEVQAYYSDPIFDLRLNENRGAQTFADDSGFGNDATCQGAACPTAGDDGMRRAAASFAGDDYLSVDGATASGVSPLDLSGGDFSFSTWLYPTGGPHDSSCPLRAEYWNFMNPGWQKVFTRCEDWPIDYDWGSGGPGGGVHNDNFWVTWRGTFFFERGDYTFRTTHDDTIYVEIDGQEIIDNNNVGTDVETVHLNAGMHSIYVSYDEYQGSARVSFDWTPAPEYHPQGILGANSGEAHVGSCRGNTCPSAATGGRYGNALTFDGSNDYAVFDDVLPRLNGNAISFGAWAHPAAALDHDAAIWAFNTGGGDNRNMLQYSPSQQRYFYFDDPNQYVYSSNTFSPDEWHHVMVVIAENNAAILYVDGNVEAAFTSSVRPDKNGRLSLGQEWDNTNPSEHFQGLIDEAAIYNQALSQVQVQGLMNQNPPPGAVVRLPFDEAVSATTWADATYYEGSYPSLQRVDNNEVRFSFSTPSGRFVLTSDADVLRSYQWNHVVGTYNGGYLTLYVNGVEVGQVTASGSPAANAAFDIGRTSSYYEVEFDQARMIGAGDPNDASADYGSEYVLQSQDGNSPWGTIWQITAMLRNNVAQLDFRLPFWQSASLNMFESDDGEYDFCGFGNCPDDPDDDPMGLYNLGEYPLTVAGATHVFEGTHTVRGHTVHDEVQLTYNITNDSIPLRGKLDEVQIYQYALTPGEVGDLYETGSLALSLHLDDAPGSTEFLDSLNQGSGTCDGEACPTVGVPGRENFALRFGSEADGIGDYVTIEDAATADLENFTLSAWVQLKSLPGGVMRFVTLSDEKAVLRYENGDLDFYATIDGDIHHIRPGLALSADTWLHVAGTYDGSEMKLYLNGAQVGATLPVSGTLGAGDSVWLSHPTESLAGLLDEVVVYRRALSAAKIADLYHAAPELLLFLDEDQPGTTYFADASGNDHDASCSGNRCPQAGVKGWLGLAGQFDGSNDYLDVPHNAALDPGDELTLAAWVKLTDADIDQKIAGKATSSGGYSGYVLGISSGHLYPEVWDTDHTRFSDEWGNIPSDIWTHIAFTWKTDGDLIGYINGEEVGRIAAGGSPIGGSSNPFRVGMAPWNTSSFPANGRIDHVTLYTRALESSELRSLFRLQAKWVEQRQNTAITVDADAPASVLVSDETYRRDVGVVLLVSTQDATSAVAMLELGVSRDGGATFTWQAAPPCQDGGSDTWCPTFSPDGEGIYTLQTRATDAVGNREIPAQTYTFIVDETPPQAATATPNGQMLDPERLPGNAWGVTLLGTVADPLVAGLPGSGPAAVEVKLTATENPTDTLQQAATLSDSTWTLDYRFDEAEPTGSYTVSVKSTDALGNATDFVPLITISLDATAPDASLNGANSLTETITTTLTLSGPITETAAINSGIAGLQLNLVPMAMDAISGTLAVFHLDEPAGGLGFNNDFGGAAACEGNSCPVAGDPGLWGTALHFDGSNDYLAADFVSEDITATNGLAFGAWIRHEYGDGHDYILAFHDAAGNNRNALKLYDHHLCYNDPQVGDRCGEYLFEETWYHIMVSIDEAGSGTLYLNGQPLRTFQTDVRPAPDGRFTLGQDWDGDTPSDFYRGWLDEIMVYDRALAPEEVRALYTLAAVNPLGAGVIQSTWAYTIPEGIEGLYQLNLRPFDLFENAASRPTWPVWNGSIDTRPPQVSVTADEEVSYLDMRTNYTCRARDFNLVETSADHPEYNFDCPCTRLAPLSTDITRTYYHEVSPWYAGVFTDTTRLYELTATCTLPGPALAASDVNACDAFGRCSNAIAEPSEIFPYGTLYSLVYTPTQNAAITNLAPLQIEWQAYARDHLQSVVVTVDGLLIDTVNWGPPDPVITSTNRTSTWLTPVEGVHTLTTVATDYNGQTQSPTYPVQIYVDVTPPVVTINPLVLTTTHRLSQNRVELSGSATDLTSGVDHVEVNIEGQGWQPAALDGERWTFAWYLDPEPEGEIFSVSTRATDLAGHSFQVTENVLVDLYVPNPITLTLSTAGEVITPGMTIRSLPTVLDLSWITATQRSDLTYEVWWQIYDDAQNSVMFPPFPLPPSGPFAAQYTASDGQRIVPTVLTKLNDGNVQRDVWGSIYVDSPLTPDYIALQDSGQRYPYTGWMDSGCSLIEVDRRLSQNAPGSAALEDPQQLYLTWDSAALRIAWQGANWDYAGDLFLYLDTVAGGALRAFNPFTDTIGADIEFPDDLGFGADVLLWVEDSHTAHILTWNGLTWDQMPLTPANYRYLPDGEGGQTHLYIPLDWLGISSPASSSLGLIAYATEEDVLSLWSSLPSANPVSSAFSLDTLEFAPESYTLPLSQIYFWPSLGAGICPNLPFGDADLSFGLSADPVGTAYSLNADGLFWLSEDLLDPLNLPADFSQSLAFLDTSHPLLGHGNWITYTLVYTNSGTQAAQGVQVIAQGLYALQLQGGSNNLVTHTLGTIPPGGSGSISFQAQVDILTGYDQCVAQTGDPAQCQDFRLWANLQVHAFDSVYGLAGYPRDLLFASHEVDVSPPVSLTLTGPAMYLAQGVNVFAGTASDPSGVPSLTLETDAGQQPCVDSVPDDGLWNCALDIGSLPDGTSVNVRIQATDRYGNTGDWSDWRTLIVDAAPPTAGFSEFTAAYSETVISAHGLSFSGSLDDNRALGAASACLNGECGPASVQVAITATTGSWFYPVSGLGDLDYVAHMLTVTPTDQVGNTGAPITLNFIMDNVPPQLTLTSAETLAEMPPAGGAIRAAEGTLGDGGDIVSAYAIVRTPSGKYVAMPLGRDTGGNWWFDLIPPEPGRYTYWVSAVDEGENTSTLEAQTITVVHLAASSSAPTALGQSTALTATLSGAEGYIFNWNLGDGSSASGGQVNHTYLAIGVYTATLTAASGTQTFQAETVILIEEAITGLQASGNSPVLIGDPALFTATLASGSDVTYFWNLGDHFTLYGADIGHAYASGGKYTITLTAYNHVSAVTATLQALATQITVTNSSPTEVGNLTYFTTTVSHGDVLAYTWDFGDGAGAGGAQSAHAYELPGVYTATVTADFGFGTLQANTPVTITGLVVQNDSPTVLGNATHFTATTSLSGNISFDWNFGDGALQTAQGALISYTYQAAGIYTAVVTATNGIEWLAADTTVWIDGQAPTVTITIPTNGQILTGTAYIIRGTAWDDIGLAHIEVSTDGGATWHLAQGLESWQYAWTLPLEDGIEHTLLARATDRAGRVGLSEAVVVIVQRVDVLWRVYLPLIVK